MPLFFRAEPHVGQQLIRHDIGQRVAIGPRISQKGIHQFACLRSGQLAVIRRTLRGDRR